MRKNLFLTRGTLGLALAASVFLGCQDFLGGDNGKPTAAPVDENVDHAAQAIVSQDSVKDMPAQTAAIEPSKPAVTEPALPATDPAKPTEPANPSPSPASTGLTPEQQVCLDLYNGLQTTKDPEYGEYKNKYGSLNCDVVLGDKKPVPPPPVPLTIEEQCKMYQYNVIHYTPTTPDPKYEAYMAQMAITCAATPAAQPAAIEPAKPAVTEPAIPAVTEPVKPTEPANPSPAPASTGLTPEQQVCLDLYNGLQTTKDPEYGEYKNKYGSLNCDVVLGDKKPVPPPPVPLTIEEKCKMYRYNVIHSTPTTPDPKYEAYMAEMAITCAAYP